MIVLAGKNDISVNAFFYVYKKIGKNFYVVCNSTDTGEDGWQRSLKKAASDNGVKEISLAEAYDIATVFISLEFDQLVRPDEFRKGRAYNIHFSLLPQYKGMYTSIWPLINNEKVSGVTLHEIDHGIDTGDVIDQIRFPLSENDRARDLYKKYLISGFELFKKNFECIIDGSAASKKQSKVGSSYYSKKSLDLPNIKIDLNQTAYSIVRQIYAFSFREYQIPCVYGRRVVEAEILDQKSTLKAGGVVAKEKSYLIISTVDYDLKLYFDGIDNLNEFSNCTVERAKKLLLALSGINDRNEHGWSPIIVAAYNGNYEVVDFLLKNGADVNDMNVKGTSVLMYAKNYALKHKDRKVFDLLVRNGAYIEHRDFSGNRLLDYISEKEAEFLGVDR